MHGVRMCSVCVCVCVCVCLCVFTVAFQNELDDLSVGIPNMHCSAALILLVADESFTFRSVHQCCVDLLALG